MKWAFFIHNLAAAAAVSARENSKKMPLPSTGSNRSKAALYKAFGRLFTKEIKSHFVLIVL